VNSGPFFVLKTLRTTLFLAGVNAMKFTMLFLLFWVACPCSSWAIDFDQLRSDFNQANGFVLMKDGTDILVSFDGNFRPSKGAILTVIKAGEIITHPKTGETVGRLEGIASFLQVKAVKDGYSVTTKMSGTGSVERGDLIRSFESVPTIFTSEEKHGEISQAIRRHLDFLDWDISEKKTPLLTFKCELNRLRALDLSGVELFSYPLDEDSSAFILPVDNSVNAKPKTQINNNAATQNIPSAVAPQKKNIENLPVFNSEIRFVSVGDLNGDGLSEIITGTTRDVIVGQIVDGIYAEKARWAIPPRLSLLGLGVFDTDKDGADEICLTLANEYRLTSQVMKLADSELIAIVKNIPWFFHVVSFPHEGEILLAQRGGGREFYEGRPFRVLRKEGQLSAGDTVALPGHVDLYGFTAVAYDDNRETGYLYLDDSDYLRFKTEAGDTVWESSRKYGGSEVPFTLEPVSADDLPAISFIKPQISINQRGVIIVPENDGSRIAQRYRKFKNSRLSAFSWDGNSLQPVWQTADFGGHLADFDFADSDNDGKEDIVVGVKFQRKGLFSKPKSNLFVLE